MNDVTLATVGQIVWRLIECHDLAPEPFFRAVGVDPQIIRDPHARIARAKSDALIRVLATKIPDPAFGLKAAQCWHPSNLGALGHAWLSSSTLHTALSRMVRYWRIVVSDVAVRLDESKEGVEFVHTPPALDDDLDRIRGDMAMAILFDMCRTNFGRAFRAKHIAFGHLAPADARPYEAFFGCPVTFNAGSNRMLIGRADADHPLPTANQQLAAVHDGILAEELARIDKTDVMARVRSSVLERMASGELSEEDSASDLHMSRRSLQRRLAEADATYQSLVDDTRRDLALRYIQDPAKSATDITFLLGYSQQSAFTRAFRRWTGTSPSEYRSRQSTATA
ncbi:MAG: AraC family transcriptional regulator [Proteobacteria bacterium]|nr:AraC family transcriptional regulator [Pseudomonadota bacterium]